MRHRQIGFIIGCLLATNILAQQDYTTTRRITSADGLSNDFVVRMAIDGRGYVWAGTEAGVNRIAGNKCKTFTTAPGKDRELITALYYHRPTKQMLIGTEHGLSIYDCQRGGMRQMTVANGLIAYSIDGIAESDKGVWLISGNGHVQHLDCKTYEVKELPLNETHGNRCGMDDGRGRLYLGHSQRGMSIVDIGSGRMTRFEHNPQDIKSIPGNNVRKIMKDSKGRVWVGTERGLALFHPEDGRFEKVRNGRHDYDDNVYDICETKDGSIWVAMDMGGVRRVTGGLLMEEPALGLSSRNTRCIVEDEYGNMWVGNHSTGIDFLSAQEPLFHVMNYSDGSGQQMHVYSLSRDEDGYIWTGSEDELACWQSNALQSRWPGRGNTTREHTFPRTLLADSQGVVWIGIEDEGVYRFDRTKRKFEHIDIGHEGCDIHAFAEDRTGRIWIGSELGVCTYQNGTVRWEDGINKIIRNAPVTTFLWTDDDRLLMTTLGIGVYSLSTGDTDASVLSRGTADGTLPTDKINHAISDGKGGVWLGSYEGLIHVADAVHLEGITVYDRKHGLADNHVRALQMDRDRIWMSTYSGISCFDPKTERFYNYNRFDNRYLSGFASGAAATDKEGRIYFASAQGVCYFNPRDFDSRRLVSEVQIVSCEVYNPMGSDTEILSLTPHDDGRVHASYEQNTLRLMFTVRNAAQTGDEEYAYMMKGMSNRWYYIDGDQDVVFRGLAPGNYTFILRARLKGQDWEDASETQLDISIAPPLWRTWWAYLLYAMVIGAVVWYMFHSYQRRLKLRNSLELEKQEHRQKQELNEERLRFFTNVTHELRTPLTLILGPLEDLIDDRQLPQASKQKVMMIHKSAEQLRNLINSILEFRKTETQNRRLTVAKGDIGQFVREICLNFKELTRNQKVQFCCEVDEDLPKVFFDSEVINTVMNNYLSNAIKYTEAGTIKVEVSRKDEARIAISVADTGYGIAAEALPHVFERYYQADGNHQASGTGIGLALVKSLADLHEAEVSVDSREGQGSRFTFSLYIDNTYPNALHKEDVEREEGRGKKEELATAKDADEASQPLLLVVEDNDDIRQYIADSFGEEYRILQAANGEEGVVTAQEQMPDIIVSDIMMPRMNGIELTKTLKEDIRTSHIPIILLTAKDSDEDKEEGYDSGADSYLTKPFTAKLLGSRIRNILASRRRLAEQIVICPTPVAGAPSGGEQTSQLSRLDQAFIDKLNHLIEDNIMQEDIDLAFVTDKMAMSHSTFYRKVKALTGLTAKEYIRKRRLRHCYQLLQSGDYNVSQAAMMTGFNQMAHFRETFKKEFGILPSEVRRK